MAGIPAKAIIGAATAAAAFAMRNAGSISEAWKVINQDGRATAQARKLSDGVRIYFGEKNPAVRLRKQMGVLAASLTTETEASPEQLADWQLRLTNLRRRLDLTEAEPPAARKKHLKQLDAAVAALFTEMIELTVHREVETPVKRPRLGRG